MDLGSSCDRRLVEAIESEARVAADALCDHLTRTCPERTTLSLPSALHLAAAVRWRRWLGTGLVERAETPDPSTADFASKTLKFWLENFAWTARQQLNVDVRLTHVDSESSCLISGLARLLKNTG